MTDRKLSDAEALALWRRAEQRLRLLDTEPPVNIDQVDALLRIVGPRRPGEAFGDWLMRSQAPRTTADARPSAEIIPFSPQFSARRQRFTPVAEIVRLAADSAGGQIALPRRELQTADGRFRLKVTREGDQVVLEIQALGLAADEFAGRVIGLAGAGGAPEPLAMLQLDADGDGQVRLPDAPELRVELLKPVIGVVEYV